MHVVRSSELQQCELHLLYSIIKKQDGHCDVKLGRTTLPKQRNSFQRTTESREPF